MKRIISRREPGLFDYQNRMAELSRKAHALEKLDQCIRWELFREVLEEVFGREEKGLGGRPRYDPVMMFKVLVLQRYYNLSDEQTEFQIKDRLTFQKFLGLSLSDKAPDEKTIWLFREALVKAGAFKKLFRKFEGHLGEAGLTGREGKIIDASFVDVPRQRNCREENEIIKAGAVPVEFGKNENKLEQKDIDARWTKKGEEVHYGYKNHVKVDRKTKLIEDYEVTDASVHDSQVIEDLIEGDDGELHADSAYRGEEIERKLFEKGIRSEIHERAYRSRPLTEAQKVSNRQKSKLRARVEHVFGQMTNGMREGLKLKWIGRRRITAGVGLLNLVYNMLRYEQIVRLNLA